MTGGQNQVFLAYLDGKKTLNLAGLPVVVSSGWKTRLTTHDIYDNSKRNPANPDPSKEVVWGDQSFEEMFFTQLRYRWIDETAEKQTTYDDDMMKTRLIGMMDTNIDSKVQIDELKGRFEDVTNEVGKGLVPAISDAIEQVDEMITAVGEALNAAVSGTMTVDEALAQANDAINTIQSR